MEMAIQPSAPFTHVVQGARDILAIQGDRVVHRRWGLWVWLLELFWPGAGTEWIAVEHATVHLREWTGEVTDWRGARLETHVSVFVHFDGGPWRQVDGCANPMVAKDFAAEVERLRKRALGE